MGISLGDSVNLGKRLNLGDALNFGAGLTGDGGGVIPTTDSLLQENGFYLLQENGSFILLS